MSSNWYGDSGNHFPYRSFSRMSSMMVALVRAYSSGLYCRLRMQYCFARREMQPKQSLQFWHVSQYSRFELNQTPIEKFMLNPQFETPS